MNYKTLTNIGTASMDNTMPDFFYGHQETRGDILTVVPTPANPVAFYFDDCVTTSRHGSQERATIDEFFLRKGQCVPA